VVGEPGGPHIVGRHRSYPIEIVAARTAVGAGHSAPIAPVPVLHQRLGVLAATIVVITHSPYIVGRYGCDTGEVAVRAGGVRAGHDAPTAPVPVLHQCSAAIFAHGPYIVGRYSVYPIEIAVVLVRARAGHDAPTAAV